MVDPITLFEKKINVLAKAIADYNAGAQGRKNSVTGAQGHRGTDIQPPETGNEIFDYHAGKSTHLKNVISRYIIDLKKGVWDLVEVRKADSTNEILLLDIINKVSEVKQSDAIPVVEAKLSKILFLVSKLVPNASENAQASQLTFEVPEMPEEVVDDLMADLNEIRKCFDAGCHRSAIIICGRVLETALNRKYFEVSGNDLLETSPGLGLGKIIAKLEEKGVHLDPGLTQQIHMINQVRIFSVHKKKEAFYPSKGQTQAMILYTVDVLRKLFSK